MSDSLRRQRRMERVQQRLAHGDLEGATELLQQMLAEDPDDAAAHALLSICLLDRKLVGPAEAEAVAALALDPEEALAHSALGNVRMAERQLAPAAACFARAIALDPDGVYARLRLATLERLRGRPYAHHLEQALEHHPDDADVLAALSRHHLEAGRVDRAQDLALRALAADAESHDALLAMGWLRLHDNRISDALEHAAMALRQDPGSEEALHLLGSIKARKSILLGAWFRWNQWMSSLGDRRMVGVLVGAFLVYRLLVALAEDLGREDVAGFVRLVWLGVVVYTWIAPGVFARMLAKDLRRTELRDDY